SHPPPRSTLFPYTTLFRSEARHAVVVERLQLLVSLAVGPVRVVGRHARVGHVAEHLAVVADLELLREAVEAELGDLLPDARVPVLEVLERVVRHGPTGLARGRARGTP